jgi:hypothetical protein
MIFQNQVNCGFLQTILFQTKQSFIICWDWWTCHNLIVSFVHKEHQILKCVVSQLVNLLLWESKNVHVYSARGQRMSKLYKPEKAQKTQWKFENFKF